jgi:hypothetical protein
MGNSTAISGAATVATVIPAYVLVLLALPQLPLTDAFTLPNAVPAKLKAFTPTPKARLRKRKV